MIMDGEYSSLQLISICLSFQDASVKIISEEYLSDTKDNHTYYDSKKSFFFKNIHYHNFKRDLFQKH